MDDAATSDAAIAPTPAVDDDLESDSLMSQLRVIEDQPLPSRAAAFGQLHERLQRRLEGGDAPASHG